LSPVVLDASVFVAMISPSEIHHARARECYRSHSADEVFWVPSLFRLEVLAALARRGEARELLDTVDALVCGPRFYPVPTDELVERAVDVARKARLRAFDAIYAALSLSRGAVLMTMDGGLKRHLVAAFPDVRVVPD
jgi:predicted nucleic acid-binding protein